jgi:tRNA U34 5-methylaminomethyl-2-thiouridine-forming methyltransferase MnmC
MNFKLITTEDGSPSFYSELFAEAGHSTSGAVSETRLHYIQGCQVEKKAAEANPLAIFETGFGIGIGFKETVKFFQEKKVTSKLHFVSTEIDPSLVDYVMANDPFFKNYDKDQFQLDILIGDARITLPEYLKTNSVQFDCFYQDAFSPRKNPTLWTTQWFSLLRSAAKKDAILSTYSASSSIRKSLLASGWALFAGEKFGPKRASTRARPQGESEAAILEQLSRSPAVVLTDENARAYQNKEI